MEPNWPDDHRRLAGVGEDDQKEKKKRSKGGKKPSARAPVVFWENIPGREMSAQAPRRSGAATDVLNILSCSQRSMLFQDDFLCHFSCSLHCTLIYEIGCKRRPPLLGKGLGFYIIYILVVGGL